MKVIFVFITLSVLFSQKRIHENPSNYFQEDYEEAIRFYQKKYNRLQNIIVQEDANEELVLSIGFPELIRYSMWRDMLETRMNELFYIRKGKPASNFSIGRFQLKPSFIEKLEKAIRNDTVLSEEYKHIFQFHTNSIKQERKKRIERLKSYKWQIRYLAVFTKVVESRFSINDTNKTMAERITFFSSALNHDFLCDSTEIIQWSNKKNFPYGMKHSNPFSYADVAVYFYTNDYKKITEGGLNFF